MILTNSNDIAYLLVKNPDFMFRSLSATGKHGEWMGNDRICCLDEIGSPFFEVVHKDDIEEEPIELKVGCYYLAPHGIYLNPIKILCRTMFCGGVVKYLGVYGNGVPVYITSKLMVRPVADDSIPMKIIKITKKLEDQHWDIFK